MRLLHDSVRVWSRWSCWTVGLIQGGQPRHQWVGGLHLPDLYPTGAFDQVWLAAGPGRIERSGPKCLPIIQYHSYSDNILPYFTSSTAQCRGGSFKNRKPIGEVGCCESGMAERSHWWTERCLRSPLFSLSLSLSLFLSVSLSFSDYLPTYLPTDLSVYLSIYLSVYLSPYVFI